MSSTQEVLEGMEYTMMNDNTFRPDSNFDEEDIEQLLKKFKEQVDDVGKNTQNYLNIIFSTVKDDLRGKTVTQRHAYMKEAEEGLVGLAGFFFKLLQKLRQFVVNMCRAIREKVANFIELVEKTFKGIYEKFFSY